MYRGPCTHSQALAELTFTGLLVSSPILVHLQQDKCLFSYMLGRAIYQYYIHIVK